MSLSFAHDHLYVTLDVDKVDKDYITLKSLDIAHFNDTFENDPDADLRIPLVDLEGDATFLLYGLRDHSGYTDEGTCSLCGGGRGWDDSDEMGIEYPYSIDPEAFDVHAKLAEDLSSIEFTVKMWLLGGVRIATGTFKVLPEHLIK